MQKILCAPEAQPADYGANKSRDPRSKAELTMGGLYIR